MAGTRHRTISGLAALVGLASLAGGCRFFDIGNPLLPTARLIAQPTPSLITVKYTYSTQNGGAIQSQPQDATYQVSSYPGDTSPGVMINSYSAQYYDQNNQEIPSIFLAKENFNVTQYVPPASAAKPSLVTLTLPIYNQQVRLFGQDLAYSFAGGAQLVRNFSHTITASVTLYGQDDNYNQIQIPFSVPIEFAADITN